MMTTRLLLQVCAVGLLLCPAAVRSDLHMNFIYDLSEICTASLNGTYFVEDLSHLTEGVKKCEDKFFCKVQEILSSLKHACGSSGTLVRSLETYSKSRKVNCAEALRGLTRTGDKATVSKLLARLRFCVRHRNLTATK